MKITTLRRFTGLAALGMLSVSTNVLANGFAVNLWNIGQATAGSGASFGDVSTMTINPAAALGFMKGHNISVAGNVVIPSFKFTGTSNYQVTNNNKISGGDGGDGGKAAFIPAVQMGWSFNDKLKLGLGVTAPFGLATKYDDNWKGRFHNIKSEVKNININPAFAYKFNEMFAIGGGVQIAYTDVTLIKKIDVNGNVVEAVKANVPAGNVQNILLGLVNLNLPQGANTETGASATGSKWAVGWNIGLAFKPIATVRFGLSYVSQINNTLKGDIKYNRGAQVTPGLTTLGAGPLAAIATAASDALTDQSIKAPLTLPAKATLSAAWDFHNQWTVFGELVHTSWSKLKEVRIRFSKAGVDDNVVPYNWRDTISPAVGLNYRPNKDWTLRVGYKYDPTPVKEEFRTPALPDNDRHWAAAGFTWAPKDTGWEVSANYAYEFIKDAKINLTPGKDGYKAAQGALDGKFKSGAHLIGLQANYRW